MLQEEFDHPITSNMALYSCYAYLRKPQPDPWDPQPKPKPVEPAEVVKVRVDYLREPFFDDHFDLVKPEHLIGKTLVGFGNHLAANHLDTDPVAATSILLGWTLFEKYDKLLGCLDEILSNPAEPMIYKEWFQLCQKSINKESELAEKLNNFLSHLESRGYLVDSDIQLAISERIKVAVADHEKSDIAAQVQLYKSWDQQREEEVDKQVRLMEHRKRLAILEAKKKELQEKEERLNFFDNIDSWELRFEENEVKRQELAKKIEGRSKKVSSKIQKQAEEDAYFPPEIVKGRSK